MYLTHTRPVYPDPFVYRYFYRAYRGVPCPPVAQAIAGKKLLIHTTPTEVVTEGEECIGGAGMGDCMECIMWAPIFARAGAIVGLDVPKDVRRLLATVEGVHEVVTDWESFRPDYQCHMIVTQKYGMALQQDLTPDQQSRFGIRDVRQFAHLCPKGYIRAPYRMDLGPRDGRLRVGLCWHGSRKHTIDPVRSADLEWLAALGSVKRVSWYSLQFGDGRDQLADAPFPIIDRTQEISDFYDCAAMVDALDLVVSVDTGMAQLPGAMGKRMMFLMADLHCTNNPLIVGNRALTQPNTEIIWPPDGPVDLRRSPNTCPAVWRSIAEAAADRLKGIIRDIELFAPALLPPPT